MIGQLVLHFQLGQITYELIMNAWYSQRRNGHRLYPRHEFLFIFYFLFIYISVYQREMGTSYMVLYTNH